MTMQMERHSQNQSGKIVGTPENTNDSLVVWELDGVSTALEALLQTASDNDQHDLGDQRELHPSLHKLWWLEAADWLYEARLRLFGLYLTTPLYYVARAYCSKGYT